MRTGSGAINDRVYLAGPRLFDGAEVGERFSFENDFLAPRIATLGPFAYEADDDFLDMGVPENYTGAAALLRGPPMRRS